jgi:DNA transformation protein
MGRSAKQPEFLGHVLDLLQPLGEVRARAMFGGWGLYFEERIFAIIAFDTLYFKVDDVNRAEFVAYRLQPFRYEGKGNAIEMSYYHPPAEALERSAVLCEWAWKGIAAARRAEKKKPALRKTKKRN